MTKDISASRYSNQQIIRAIQKYGTYRQTAKALNYHYRSLYNRCKRLGIRSLYTHQKNPQSIISKIQKGELVKLYSYVTPEIRDGLKQRATRENKPFRVLLLEILEKESL